MKRKGKTMRNDGVLRIYTDGGCAGNQHDKNLGGWGAVLEYGAPTEKKSSAGAAGSQANVAIKELYGSETNTTNNRMEMTALLEAFRAIKKERQNIEVFSDSSYLMDCFRKKWYVNWMKNGWKTAKKTPVENRDLWTELLPYLDRHNIEFFRVKGHVALNSAQTECGQSGSAQAQDGEASIETKSGSLAGLYEKFCEWNGTRFSFDEFIHVTKRNNRADELANMGIDEIR